MTTGQRPTRPTSAPVLSGWALVVIGTVVSIVGYVLLVHAGGLTPDTAVESIAGAVLALGGSTLALVGAVAEGVRLGLRLDRDPRRP